MMVHDLSNQRRRSSFSRGGDNEGGTLKSMMSNLLPSLDASMDSHFSKDFSHSEMTATTAQHTSATSYSFGHDDLGDSSSDLSVSSRLRSKGAKVTKTLKKAFNKVAKKTTSSSSSKKTSSKKNSDTKKSKRKPKGLLDNIEGGSDMRKSYDENSVDDSIFADPPTVCSAAAEEEPPQQQHHSDHDEQPQRRHRSRSRTGKRPKDKGRSRSRSESESSESGRHLERRRAPSNSNNNKSKGKREELKKRRSSRRGGNKTGGRMPPKSKSFDCDRGHPPPLTAMGDLIAMGGGDRHEPPRRASSFVAKDKQQRNRSSNVTAQAALPNPRPSMAGSRRSSTKQSTTGSSGAHRRKSGDGKAISRSRSLKHVEDDSTTRKSISRSKSFNKQGAGSGGDTTPTEARSTRKKPSRAKSFDGATNMDPTRAPLRRSASRTREVKRKSMPAHRQSEDEAGGAPSNKGAAEPEPLFSLEDHFDGSTSADTKLDEISIDTCSTAGVEKNKSLLSTHRSGSLSKMNSNKAKNERRRSKSRSASPSDRRRSRSPSQSRTRERSVSRRPSVHERRMSQRGRSQSGSRHSSSERDQSRRSQSRSRRSSSERERSQSRSRRPSVSTRSSIKQERGRSKSAAARRPSQTQQHRSKSQQKRRSISAKRRPSVQSQRSRSSSRSRRESGVSAKSLKQYETLCKEDFQVPNAANNNAQGRRPRSLSRTKKSPKARVSRSLSTTRKSKEHHEGIGDYLQRQSPQAKKPDEDTNSQSTGSKTTGSAEVTYATPSWMWNNSTTSGSFNTSFFNKDDWSSFGGSTMKDESKGSLGATKEESTKDESNSSEGGDGQNLFQASFTSFEASYDGCSEMSVSRGFSTWSDMSTPKGATTAFPNTSGGNGISPPLMPTDPNQSTSSLSASATPCTKAKHFYGKVMKKEQEELRAQSQKLFENVNLAHAATDNAPHASMFSPLHQV